LGDQRIEKKRVEKTNYAMGGMGQKKIAGATRRGGLGGSGMSRGKATKGGNQGKKNGEKHGKCRGVGEGANFPHAALVCRKHDKAMFGKGGKGTNKTGGQGERKGPDSPAPTGKSKEKARNGQRKPGKKKAHRKEKEHKQR